MKCVKEIKVKFKVSSAQLVNECRSKVQDGRRAGRTQSDQTQTLSVVH